MGEPFVAVKTSSVVTLYESEQCRYDFDARYGVGWYVRLSDDTVTLLNTGTDAEEEALRWEQFAEEGRNSISYHRKNAIFDSVASEREFTPRWD